MIKEYYVIVTSSTFADRGRLHQIINDGVVVEDWWHYLDTAYIVGARVDIPTMQSVLTKAFPGEHFLIIDINPKYFGGYLHTDAWKWLERLRGLPFEFKQNP